MDLALLGRAMGNDENDRGRTSMAIAAVLGVGALDYVAAQRLAREEQPNERAERDDEREVAAKGIHVRKSVTVNRPASEVYEFWRDFENLPRFMKHLESVRDTGEGRSHWKAKAPAGRTVEWDAVITEDRPDELLAWRSLPGADVENAGTIRFRPAPGDRGTEVHVELRYDPPGGQIAAIFAKLFRQEPGQQVLDDLRRFKQVLETGEVIVSDASLARGPHPAQPPAKREPVVSYEPDILRERSDEAVRSSTATDDTDRLTETRLQR
jgi:uncharacterized membrane protein